MLIVSQPAGSSPLADAPSGSALLARRPTQAVALAQFDVAPSEAGGQKVAHVGDVEEEERHADHGVDDGHHFAENRPRRNVTVSYQQAIERKISKISLLSYPLDFLFFFSFYFLLR